MYIGRFFQKITPLSIFLKLFENYYCFPFIFMLKCSKSKCTVQNTAAGIDPKEFVVMQRFYAFCIRFLQISSLILFGALAVISFLGTASIEKPYDYVIHLKLDNPLLNLLFLICYLGIFFVVGSLFSRKKSGSIICLTLTCLWIFSVSLLWIYFSKNGPIADGASVYYAAKCFANDNFSAVSYRDSYFSVYPFQLGLAFFYELVFRFVHSDNYHILQGINAVCLVVCTISQYHLCGLFFQNKKAQNYTLFFIATCAPFIMYSSFIYGEIPSITFSLFGTWMLLLFLKNSDKVAFKVIIGILALLSISAGMLVRKNSLVFLIALSIISCLWLISNKSGFSAKKFALYTAYFVILFSLSAAALPLVQSRYAARSGESINSGVPAASYLAMGLSETEVGPGFYDGSNFETFTTTADYDAETAARSAWKTYHERLDYFIKHPGYSLRFFFKKFCAEWIDTGWAVFPATYNSYGDRPPFVESLFSGAFHVPFKNYINSCQMTLYIASALCMFSLFRQKKDRDVFPYLFPLTAFGGALLFLVWETNGRYILPYGIFMFPYAGYGAHLLLERVKTSFRR